MESGAFGREREGGSYLTTSLVDCSLSMNVHMETYHLGGAWKSQSTLMYIFSDILKAVRFHKWQVNLK